MKKRLVFSFVVIAIMTFLASCTKEETPTVYKPIDYISVRRAEYLIRNDVAYKVRFSISNQSDKTLYYCKFRVTQCNENEIGFYSDVYEVGSKNDMSSWSLSPGDIQFTDYYSCDFLFKDISGIKSDIIDADFY